MKHLPGKPFTIKDFSPQGGGIDFLGLRWVGLTIVGRDLIPELNNVTTDMGTFFLGAWIPWKFHQLCQNEKDYTEKKYKAFREKIEVALSLTFREESGLDRDYGDVRNRIGNKQSCSMPTVLSFKAAHRNDSNSLYAAAIYGPSIHALGLITSYRSQAQSGKEPLSIAVTGDDSDTTHIVTGVDASLKKATNYRLIASLDSPEFDWNDIRLLGKAGLDPARYRALAYMTLKEAFSRKLLPQTPHDPGYARTLTARLILTTIRQRSGLSAEDMRNVWYAGMFSNGKPFKIKDEQLSAQQTRWSFFMARQYQRYAIELFLWCFEDGLLNGCRAVDEVIDHWMNRSKSGGEPLRGTFHDILKTRVGRLLRKDDILTSQAWNDEVPPGDSRFEYVEEPQNDKAVFHGLSMLAGWYWRMLSREQTGTMKELLTLGGSDRMSMSWFLQWLRLRQDRPIRDLLNDIFSDLIFAQHMRIALARFDGTAQRLRFLLGDSGIEPTVSARADLGQVGLPWMPDRLDTLISLLCDCDILTENKDTLGTGSRAKAVMDG